MQTYIPTVEQRQAVRAHNDSLPFMDRICEQCRKVLGPEAFMGPVCGKCCKANHRAVAGAK